MIIIIRRNSVFPLFVVSYNNNNNNTKTSIVAQWVWHTKITKPCKTSRETSFLLLPSNQPMYLLGRMLCGWPEESWVGLALLLLRWRNWNPIQSLISHSVLLPSTHSTSTIIIIIIISCSQWMQRGEYSIYCTALPPLLLLTDWLCAGWWCGLDWSRGQSTLVALLL